MVMVWLAAGAVLLIAMIWVASLVIIRAKGGGLDVDNDRDINDRYFAEVLRTILEPTLSPEWGEPEGDHWRLGSLSMRRRKEKVALYQGNLHLGRLPYRVAALVVTGNLTITDGGRVPCDIWCLGDVTVGTGCTLRALAGEGAVTLGSRSVVERWIDGARSLYLSAGATVISTASSAGEALLESGFRGAKVSAPVVRILATPNQIALEAARERLLTYLTLRESYGAATSGETKPLTSEWIQPQSVCSEGRFWIGPGTVMLHDLVVRDSLEVGENAVIAGSIHATEDCRLAPGVIVTGNVACRRLRMEAGAVVGGSVHVDGDAILGEGAIVGLLSEVGGLAVTGSVKLGDQVTVTGRISASDILYTGTGRRKAG